MSASLCREKCIEFDDCEPVKNRILRLKELGKHFAPDLFVVGKKILWIYTFSCVHIEDIKIIRVYRFKHDNSFYFCVMTKDCSVFTSKNYQKVWIKKW